MQSHPDLIFQTWNKAGQAKTPDEYRLINPIFIFTDFAALPAAEYLKRFFHR